MARVSIEVPDDQIIEFIERERGLQKGQAVRDVNVEVESVPPTDNTTTAHLVKVTLTYAFQLGELDALTRP